MRADVLIPSVILLRVCEYVTMSKDSKRFDVFEGARFGDVGRGFVMCNAGSLGKRVIDNEIWGDITSVCT